MVFGYHLWSFFFSHSSSPTTHTPWCDKSMWSPSGDDNNANNRLLTSSSSSSSSRVSTPRRTMEDVWKEINLNSLQDRPRSREEGAEPKGSYRRVMLQEFLARPFRGQQQQQQQQERASEVPAHQSELNMSILTAASNPQPATTILNLNSSPEQFHYLDSIGQLGPNPLRLQPHNSYGGDPTPPFMAASSPNDTFEAIVSSFGKKRAPENTDNSGDRRHKRMIKNRESAARSRARKQAYTNELELEVAHLIEENAKLREKQQQLVMAAASTTAPTKLSLCRTSTAPF